MLEGVSHKNMPLDENKAEIFACCFFIF